MGRPKVNIKKTEIAVIEPKVYKSAEEYADYTSALIRYGLLMYQRSLNKDQKLLTGEMIDDLYQIGGDLSIALTPQQVQYLNMRMDGISTKKSCELLKIDQAYPLLWEEEGEKNSVYRFCVEALRLIQAKQAEDVVWDKAINEGKELMLMFAVKSRLDEYKDNAKATGANVVQVNISVDKEPFVVDTNTKIIEGEIVNGGTYQEG